MIYLMGILFIATCFLGIMQYRQSLQIHKIRNNALNLKKQIEDLTPLLNNITRYLNQFEKKLHNQKTPALEDLQKHLQKVELAVVKLEKNMEKNLAKINSTEVPANGSLLDFEPGVLDPHLAFSNNVPLGLKNRDLSEQNSDPNEKMAPNDSPYQSQATQELQKNLHHFKNLQINF